MESIPPLFVDLDGTLIRTDLLQEGIFANITRLPVVLKIPFWLCRGRAYLKKKLAGECRPDVARLPYHAGVLEYLRQEKAKGRQLVLATASDRSLGQAVADYLGIFDGVIASDGHHNRKGAEKLRAIREWVNGGPFDYAGNERADLKIWKESREAVIVSGSAALRQQVEKVARVGRVFTDGAPLIQSIIKEIRPHQWSKNLLVFIPLLTSGAFTEWRSWLGGLVAFVAFSCTASGIYLANDLTDLNSDRAHPNKRRRPLASGDLPLRWGTALALGLTAAGLALGHVVGIALWLCLYVVTSLAYSIRLKEFPLVDVFSLAFLYTVRIFAGGVAVRHLTSPWLLGFSMFLFLSLAFVKRVAELEKMRGDGFAPRRGYSPRDIPILSAMGLASAFTATLVLALFIQSSDAVLRYATPGLIWLIVPVLALWLCRLWLSTSRGYMDDDPILYAAGDWVSWVSGLAVLAVMVVARYFFFSL